jgi:HAD superfamily hydrolase (TIGR01509 family)
VIALPAPSTLETLLLDAGNTLVFLDHVAVADVVTSHGVEVDARALAAVEGEAKRRYEALMAAGVSHEEAWGLYLRALLEAATVPAEAARAMVAPLRRAHDGFNLWRRVPAGMKEALARARAAGLRVAVVSNSEGMLPQLFERVGLAPCIELVVDSHHEGVRKPDPELFRRALARLGVGPERAVYLGDIPGVDVVGAHAAGIAAVLVDPLDFYPDHAASPRVESGAAWIEALLEHR